MIWNLLATNEMSITDITLVLKCIAGDIQQKSLKSGNVVYSPK